MTIAQTKAVRHFWTREDRRYKPKKGSRGGTAMNQSQRRAAAKNRKRVQAGGAAGSIGFKTKGKG